MHHVHAIMQQIGNRKLECAEYEETRSKITKITCAKIRSQKRN